MPPVRIAGVLKMPVRRRVVLGILKIKAGREVEYVCTMW
jgi:hypothetical protein